MKKQSKSTSNNAKPKNTIKSFLTNPLFIILTIIIVLLVWGIIGGIISRNIGITCDAGFYDFLCWIWHQNYIGQAQDVLAEIFN